MTTPATLRPTVCLNMIVRNESAVMARCLRRLRPLISRWVIVDTGSDDGTQGIVERELDGIPGALHERPWRNFGENRTEALHLARGLADYTFVIDADEELFASSGFEWPELTLDSYQIETVLLNLTYYRTQLLRSALDWRFEGVLHEYPMCEAARTEGRIHGLVNRPHTDGARSKDPEKYCKDAVLLEEALAREPENLRTLFYLAQSYRDAGQLQKAQGLYAERATRGGWQEEVWCSLFQVARLSELLGQPEELVSSAYLRAFEYRPTRAESPCELARYYRQRKKYALAYRFAVLAAQTERPTDILFLEPSAYEWRSLDELAVSGFHLGRYEEALAANRELLAGAGLPATERSRIERNVLLCLRKLGRDPRAEDSPLATRSPGARRRNGGHRAPKTKR